MEQAKQINYSNGEAEESFEESESQEEEEEEESNNEIIEYDSDQNLNFQDNNNVNAETREHTNINVVNQLSPEMTENIQHNFHQNSAYTGYNQSEESHIMSNITKNSNNLTVKKNFENNIMKTFNSNRNSDQISNKHSIKHSIKNSEKLNKTGSEKNSISSNFKKTPFTKISEEAYKNLMKSNSKISYYDKMISDQYLKKVSEKNSTDGAAKLSSFLARTKDYNNKRSLNILANETKRSMSRFSDNFPKSRATIRSVRTPDEYMEDQIKFVARKESTLRHIRDNIRIQSEKSMKERPSISVKSRSLARNKIKDGKEIHERLFGEKTHRLKDSILKETTKKTNERKLNEKDIALMVEKLFQDARGRNEIILSNKKMEGMIRLPTENEKIYNHTKFKIYNKNSRSLSNYKNRNLNQKLVSVDDYDLTTDYSKILMLKRFIKDFKAALEESVEHFIKTEGEGYSSHSINFQNYVELLYQIGFLKHDHKVITGDTTNIRVCSKTASKDASRYETSVMKIEKEMLIIKDSWRVLTQLKVMEGSEKVQSDQILIFCLTVIGLYKGHNAENRNESESNANLITNPLITEVIPTFDLKTYCYQIKITKQLKSLFRVFYENRIDAILSKNNENRSKIHLLNNTAQFTFRPSIDDRSIKSAERFRSKCKSQLRKDFDFESMQNKSRLRIEDIYSLIKKKKEKELTLLRREKEESRFSECSFRPKINKFYKPKSNELNEMNERPKSAEVCTRLYSNAINILRVKSMYEERKAKDVFEKDSRECTFSPKTTLLNSQIFNENPLGDDGGVRYEQERYEKARIEKNLRNLISFKGYNSINKIKDLDMVLEEYKKNEELPKFRFDNETKNNKETFYKFEKYSRDL